MGHHRTMQRWTRRLAGILALLIAAAGLAAVSTVSAQDNVVLEIPEVTVQFGHEPYFDHTQAIIGLELGWFEEVGITFEPDGQGIVVGGDEALAVFASGRVEVLSGSAQLLMPAAERLPSYKMFFFADIFQGYALMAQPDEGFRSFAEFMDDGLSPEEAFVETVGQMRGRHFAYPPEAAIQGFIALALDRGGLTLDDMETTSAEDSATVSLMQAGRADFQVGGVPSRLTLEAGGFKPILTSGDLAQYAEASAESEELRAVFHDGWLATDGWVEENYDTVLRLTGVGFRINQLINDDPEAAMAIHVPFLNSVAGTDFDEQVAEVVYTSLHPFLTFEEQAAWHLDPENPLNGEYVIGSAIRLYEEQGVFEPGAMTWEDFTIAHQIYQDMLDYRDQAEQLISELEAAGVDGEAAELLEQAKYHHQIFNYLDAYRFAEAAAAA